MRKYYCIYLNKENRRVYIDVYAVNLQEANSELWCRRGNEIKCVESIRRMR
jgi:hypothetical protein